MCLVFVLNEACPIICNLAGDRVSVSTVMMPLDADTYMETVTVAASDTGLKYPMDILARP